MTRRRVKEQQRQQDLQAREENDEPAVDQGVESQLMKEHELELESRSDPDEVVPPNQAGYEDTGSSSDDDGELLESISQATGDQSQPAAAQPDSGSATTSASQTEDSADLQAAISMSLREPSSILSR